MRPCLLVSMLLLPVTLHADELARHFPQKQEVFGVKLIATRGVPARKLAHAAGVMAQYLDNDADGKPDNPKVIAAMRKRRATLMMFTDEKEAERILEQVELPDGMAGQDLYASETHPGGARQGRFDATLEEVLHLITHAGYGPAYPRVFGERRGSAIARAMDRARGGYFARPPRRYPRGAWYTYYDATCGYGCMITEYFYWGLTSLLGGQQFRGRLEEIKAEWRLNTPAKLKRGDPALYELLTDKRYRLPTRLPDGNYEAWKRRRKKQ